jgi:uncharacterized protein
MESQNRQSRKAIALYLLLTLSLSCIFYFLIIYTGKFNRLYVYGLMWCPAFSALIACKILKREISSLGWLWGKPRYMLWSYLTPLFYSLIAYLIIWLTGWGAFYNNDFVISTAKTLGWEHLPKGTIIVVYFIFIGIYGMAQSVSTALGEEIGWRGFLVPELSKVTSYTKTSLISGIIWSVWHYPILIWGGYNSGTPVWYGLTCFTVMVVSISFVFTWFRLKSGSLWTGALLHASHNLFIQVYFTPITKDTGHTKYYTDEFGAVLPVVCLITAVYFWTRRGELTNLPQANRMQLSGVE